MEEPYSGHQTKFIMSTLKESVIAHFSNAENEGFGKWLLYKAQGIRSFNSDVLRLWGAVGGAAVKSRKQ